jgi:hypothetical protein
MKWLSSLLVGISLFGSMEASGSDWKYFGGTVLEKGEKVIAYYDTESVEYLSNGNVRTWTKAVYPSEVERILNKEEVIKKAAQKVVVGYMPPYALSNPNEVQSHDTCVEIIGWEEAAKHAEIKPRFRILFEINCKEKTIRFLSLTSYKDEGGIEGSSKTPGEWGYISPETNSETLRKILCKDRK